MPLKIIRQDITKIRCDAIVNPTNTNLFAGGGLDYKIREAAGNGLSEFCKANKIGSVGEAIISPSYDLPCKYIIHVAGPIYDGSEKCVELLKKSYESCIRLAFEYGCGEIAIPLISSGTNGFPKDKVLKVATEAIVEILFSCDMLVYLVVYDNGSYEISSRLFSDITAYIDDSYVEEDDLCYRIFEKSAYEEEYIGRRPSVRHIHPVIETAFSRQEPLCKSESIDDMLNKMDKSFAETLFYYIDKKGISDIECYKRANVDKKVFSKIKCNKGYKPSKITALSFAIGLRLDLDETEHLLKTAGMSLSHSNKLEVIVEYFIKTGNYKNIFEVNEVLYKLTEETLCV